MTIITGKVTVPLSGAGEIATVDVTISGMSTSSRAVVALAERDCISDTRSQMDFWAECTTDTLTITAEDAELCEDTDVYYVVDTDGSGVDLTAILAHIADGTIHFIEGAIDHVNILNIGTTSHADVDTHIGDATLHFVEGSIDHTAITNIGTNSHADVDTHIADATLHFVEGAIDHVNILSIGTNSHAAIDTHIADVANPHSVTAAQAGVQHSAMVRIGGLAASDDRFLFVVPPGAATIGQVTIVSDTATVGSDGANNWTFQVRNLTAANDLLSAVKTTNGAEIPADAVYDLGPDQNLSPSANDVLELQIVKTLAPTDLTAAEISAFIEWIQP